MGEAEGVKGCPAYLRAQRRRERAWEIFKKYDDQIFSFTDCVSFAQMERLDIRTALALDDDFKIMDYRVVPR